MPEPDERRRREAVRSARGEALDALLGAWIDRELPALEAQELAARAAREPAVDRRREQLAAVGEALRAIDLPAVPGRLRAELDARIARDAEGAQVAGRAGREPARAGDGRRAGADLPAAGRRARWLAPAAVAAAVAAALALAILGRDGMRRPVPETTPVARGPGAPGEAGGSAAPGRPDAAAPVRPSAPHAPHAPSPGTRLAESPEGADTPDSGVGGTGAAPGDTGGALLPGGPVDTLELALALEPGLETLRDLELIERLELLELLAEHQARGAERRGHGSG